MLKRILLFLGTGLVAYGLFFDVSGVNPYIPQIFKAIPDIIVNVPIENTGIYFVCYGLLCLMGLFFLQDFFLCDNCNCDYSRE